MNGTRPCRRRSGGGSSSGRSCAASWPRRCWSFCTTCFRWTGRWDADTAIRLLIGLVVFAGVMVWQVRAIAGSRYPGLRAAGALGLIIPLFLVLFASTYFVMERASAASFTQPLTRTDALYFTVTVFSTVGFGDITAKSETARVVLIVQMLADLAFLGAGMRVLLGAVQRGRERRPDTGDDAGQAAM